MKHAAQRCGLDIVDLQTREIQPCGYLDFNVFGYFASCAYFNVMRLTGLQRFFGMTLTGVLTKPLSATTSVRATHTETPLASPRGTKSERHHESGSLAKYVLCVGVDRLQHAHWLHGTSPRTVRSPILPRRAGATGVDAHFTSTTRALAPKTGCTTRRVRDR